MHKFNLSEWALEHQSFVLFLVVVLGVIGIFSYGKLGQSEDPPFTFKVMTVRTGWPPTCVMTSPGRMPAAPAGPLLSTPVTITP